MRQAELSGKHHRWVFEFANYRAELGQGVVCDGTAVPLPPKETAVLEVLLRREGKLVSKQELIDEVWPNQIVSDESIARCIHALRRRLPLKDTSALIETVHRRGYRMSVPVLKTQQRATQGRLLGGETSSPAAYAAYLEGRHHARQLCLESFPVAIGYFEEALRYDPDYAPALAAIAECRVGQIFFRDSAATVQLAREAGEAALALDPGLASAHASLGWIEGAVDRQVDSGLARLTHALELDPQSAQGYNYRAWLLGGLGRHEEAVADQRRAAALDPYMPFFPISVAHSLFFGGRFDEALSLCRSCGSSPRISLRYQALAKGFLCMMAGYLGRTNEVIATAESLRVVKWSSPSLRTFVAYGLAQCGQRGEAEALADELSRQAKPIASLMPAIHIALGDKKRARHWIDFAVDDHCPSLLTHVYDPRIKSLGLSPRSFVRS